MHGHIHSPPVFGLVSFCSAYTIPYHHAVLYFGAWVALYVLKVLDILPELDIVPEDVIALLINNNNTTTMTVATSFDAAVELAYDFPYLVPIIGNLYLWIYL